MEITFCNQKKNNNNLRENKGLCPKIIHFLFKNKDNVMKTGTKRGKSKGNWNSYTNISVRLLTY